MLCPCEEVERNRTERESSVLCPCPVCTHGQGFSVSLWRAEVRGDWAELISGESLPEPLIIAVPALSPACLDGISRGCGEGGESASGKNMISGPLSVFYPGDQ